MNFWSSESQQVHLIGRVVTKVNEVKNVNDLSCRGEECGERWLQTPRKVVPFRQKGGTFPGPIRLVTSDNASCKQRQRYNILQGRFRVNLR